jgi:predicted dehydrogenase
VTASAPRVLIVGLGQVGLTYDATLPDSFVYSHARACALHPGLALAGGVDPEFARRTLFTERYGAPAFDGVSDAMHATRPDVVIVATPTRTHAEVVAQVLSAGRPAAVLCEKPLAVTPVEARAIVDACAAAGVALFVNYMRSVEPGALEAGRRIASGAWRGPWSGIVWYTKGFRHNASHFWSLTERWFGPVTQARVLRRHGGWEDGDARLDVRADHADAVLHYVAVPERGLSHHSLEALGANGRLRYDHGGRTITWEPAAPNEAFVDQAMLTGVVERIPSEFDRFQWHVAAALTCALADRDHHLYTGVEALASFNRLFVLLES